MANKWTNYLDVKSQHCDYSYEKWLIIAQVSTIDYINIYFLGGK
jgi:hypothetical protein